MKKLAILLVVACIALFQNIYSKENTIYEIGVNKTQQDAVYLQLKSDYKEKIKPVQQNNKSVYIDVKNAKLSDSLKNDFKGDVGVVYQQIGSKVRIYLTGENINNLNINFAASKGMQPFDYSKMFLICAIFALVAYVVRKCYLATIMLSEYADSIRYPEETKLNLSSTLPAFGTKRNTEIVLNSTNTIKQEVYVDFKYAKNRKNTKIAI